MNEVNWFKDKHITLLTHNDIYSVVGSLYVLVVLNVRISDTRRIAYGKIDEFLSKIIYDYEKKKDLTKETLLITELVVPEKYIDKLACLIERGLSVVIFDTKLPTQKNIKNLNAKLSNGSNVDRVRNEKIYKSKLFTNEFNNVPAKAKASMQALINEIGPYKSGDDNCMIEIIQTLMLKFGGFKATQIAYEAVTLAGAKTYHEFLTYINDRKLITPMSYGDVYSDIKSNTAKIIRMTKAGVFDTNVDLMNKLYSTICNYLVETFRLDGTKLTIDDINTIGNSIMLIPHTEGYIDIVANAMLAVAPKHDGYKPLVVEVRNAPGVLHVQIRAGFGDKESILYMKGRSEPISLTKLAKTFGGGSSNYSACGFQFK